ncbi:LCP family protein [Cohnella laeviribosi]|jgi:LCP family protein required for cell wall assembly|uniref:LCP family protein n=1 Tax=Cohnella laeviribosi TaxID=380174 RepID=UPI00037E48F6|nr:LCP family protein [Cohnella laeviribosi]
MNASTPLPPRSRSAQTRRTPAPRKTKKPKRRRWATVLLSFFAVVILGLGAYAGYLYWEFNQFLNDISGGGDDKPIASADSAQVRPVSMVLLGLDTRSGTGTLNTDVLMVAAFNPKSNTATVVSIPRDSLLELDGYKKQKVNAYYSGFYREGRSEEGLNEDQAYAYAREGMRKMFGEFFGVKFDYTAIINFQGFIDVVDALGGVKVYVDQDMRYVDNADKTNIDLKKGEQVLDGKQALDFVRYRKSNRGTADSSDFARNERQARVLAAIADKLKSLGGVTRLGNVISAVGNNMTTDIPKQQITHMLKAYYDLDSEHIRFIPLEGKWKSPYVYLDDSSVQKAREALAEELSPEGRTVGGDEAASASDAG